MVKTRLKRGLRIGEKPLLLTSGRRFFLCPSFSHMTVVKQTFIAFHVMFQNRKLLEQSQWAVLISVRYLNQLSLLACRNWLKIEETTFSCFILEVWYPCLCVKIGSWSPRGLLQKKASEWNEQRLLGAADVPMLELFGHGIGLQKGKHLMVPAMPLSSVKLILPFRKEGPAVPHLFQESVMLLTARQTSVWELSGFSFTEPTTFHLISSSFQYVVFRFNPQLFSSLKAIMWSSNQIFKHCLLNYQGKDSSLHLSPAKSILGK